MGTCACINTSSSLNPKLPTFIDLPPPQTTPPFISPPFIDKPSNPSHPSKSKSTSTIQNEKTQCSSTNHDSFLTDPKSKKHISQDDMLKNSDQKLLPIPQKVVYKSHKEEGDLTSINIVIFGDKNTGKSAFVIKYVDNYFEKLYIPSIGVEHHVKKIKCAQKELHFSFWVTTGDNVYRSDYKEILDEADFIFIFYDVSMSGSFDEALKCCNSELRNYHKEYSGIMRNVVFIGNKVDVVPRKEDKEKIEKYCKENMFKLFEISVKNTNGITDVMNYITMMHMKMIEL